MKKKKEIKIKGYMTFRDKKPLHTFNRDSWDFYFEKAPTWQDGDKSVPVVLTYKER